MGFDLLYSQPNLVYMGLIHINRQSFREQVERMEHFVYDKDFQRAECIGEVAEEYDTASDH